MSSASSSDQVHIQLGDLSISISRPCSSSRPAAGDKKDPKDDKEQSEPEVEIKAEPVDEPSVPAWPAEPIWHEEDKTVELQLDVDNFVLVAGFKYPDFVVPSFPTVVYTVFKHSSEPRFQGLWIGSPVNTWQALQATFPNKDKSLFGSGVILRKGLNLEAALQLYIDKSKKAKYQMKMPPTVWQGEDPRLQQTLITQYRR